VIDLLCAAAAVEAVCKEHGWRHCFIGGLALQRWGEVRFTKDADVTVFTGYGDEMSFIEPLLDRFKSRIADAANFAEQRRILLLESDESVGIDVALGALPFEEGMVERATQFTFPPDVLLTTCSAEDLVITKTFSGRGQDWIDVERIIVRQQDKLDWPLIKAELKDLLPLKDAEDHLDELLQLREQVDNYDD
tara:strand:- start:22211 stop:22786 length:576 start_codon:yes stop_codon:yes gene_type:complete